MNSAGEFTRFREPRPRETELPFQPYQFPVITRRLLSVPDNISSAPCIEVLHLRSSRRTFGPLSEPQLSALLWFSAKTLRSRREASGFDWQHRPAPSSGGRHPIYILLMNPGVNPLAFSVYEPEGHALLDLEPLQNNLPTFAQELHAVINPESGTILWFAADFLRTASRYTDCESLIWRDAGALLATIHTASEALGLHCCAYGITGDTSLSSLLPPDRFFAVGGCVVGSSTHPLGDLPAAAMMT
jgi:SagB-type dehydrogenase family enzyme